MATSSVLVSEQTMKVSNTTGSNIDFWIEPLGDRLPMQCGDTFEIIASSELGREVEIEFGEDAIRVHGWIKRISCVLPSGGRTQLWGLPGS